MFRLINSFIIKWFDACPICGCKERDCWGRCEECGSDMHEE